MMATSDSVRQQIFELKEWINHPNQKPQDEVTKEINFLKQNIGFLQETADKTNNSDLKNLIPYLQRDHAKITKKTTRFFRRAEITAELGKIQDLYKTAQEKKRNQTLEARDIAELKGRMELINGQPFQNESLLRTQCQTLNEDINFLHREWEYDFVRGSTASIDEFNENLLQITSRPCDISEKYEQLTSLLKVLNTTLRGIVFQNHKSIAEQVSPKSGEECSVGNHQYPQLLENSFKLCEALRSILPPIKRYNQPADVKQILIELRDNKQVSKDTKLQILHAGLNQYRNSYLFLSLAYRKAKNPPSYEEWVKNCLVDDIQLLIDECNDILPGPEYEETSRQ